MQKSKGPACQRASETVTRNAATAPILPHSAEPSVVSGLWTPREQDAFEKWRRDLRTSLVALSARADDRADVQAACCVLIGFIETPERA